MSNQLLIDFFIYIDTWFFWWNRWSAEIDNELYWPVLNDNISYNVGHSVSVMHGPCIILMILGSVISDFGILSERSNLYFSILVVPENNIRLAVVNFSRTSIISIAQFWIQNVQSKVDLFSASVKSTAETSSFAWMLQISVWGDRWEQICMMFLHQEKYYWTRVLLRVSACLLSSSLGRLSTSK